MPIIKKDSKWLDDRGHICTVLMVPDDQEDLTKIMEYQYHVEDQKKEKKVTIRKLKSLSMYRFLKVMKPLNKGGE